jgi:hypothetical protein
MQIDCHREGRNGQDVPSLGRFEQPLADVVLVVGRSTVLQRRKGLSW